MRRRVLSGLVALVALPAAPAGAATYCVGVQAEGCTQRASAAEAFASARADAALDTILLGRLTEAGAFADAAGRPVRVVGAGAAATVLRASGSAPALRIADAETSAAGLRLEGGDATALQLDGGGSLQSAMVAGRVAVAGGDAALESVTVAAGGPAVRAGCEQGAVALRLHHVTVTGSGPAGVATDCADLTVSNSIVWGFQEGFAVTGGGTLSSSWSTYPGASGDGDRTGDPGFMGAGDVRLRADSPLLDAGRPGALEAGEPHEDALGYVRAVDGDGDGTPRRDPGALEHQPPPPPAADGNVLSNPGAEAGTPAGDDRASPAPPSWAREGGFTFVRYGTLAGSVPFPTRRAAEALGAGDAFFAGGPSGRSSATQVADLGASAPEIDLGLGTVALSALLGGYRASPDGGVVEAEFRDPAGAPLGRVEIGPVSPEERAEATTLAYRAAEAPIPPLTRTVAVSMRTRPPSGSYDDAYFDSVALVPRTAGAPPPAQPPGTEQGVPLRPFAGAAVLSSRAGVDRRRRAWVRLACASATVDRCRGVVTLTARLGGAAAQRVGSRRFALRPGRMGRVPVRLTLAARRALRETRRLRGRLYAATRDGQGLTRTSTSPLRIERGVLWGRQSHSEVGRRPAPARGSPGTRGARARRPVGRRCAVRRPRWSAAAAARRRSAGPRRSGARRPACPRRSTRRRGRGGSRGWRGRPARSRSPAPWIATSARATSGALRRASGAGTGSRDPVV